MSTTHTPWSQVEAAAMAYAARLDVLLAVLDARAVYLPADAALEEALHAVGTLLGGLGYKGFAHDLRRHLDTLEEEMILDAPRCDYSPGLGGNDPDAVLSSRLEDMIHQARSDDCADWLASAQDVLAQRQQPVAEAA